MRKLSWFLHATLTTLSWHDKSCPLIWTTPSGQLHRDTKRSSTYRYFAKTHANPDPNDLTVVRAGTDGNSLNRRAVICKVLDTWQLDYLDNHPTYNCKSHNFHTYTRTPNTQARVWQLPPRHTTLLPNTCFFAYPDFTGKTLVRAQRQHDQWYLYPHNHQWFRPDEKSTWHIRPLF